MLESVNGIWGRHLKIIINLLAANIAPDG